MELTAFWLMLGLCCVVHVCSDAPLVHANIGAGGMSNSAAVALQCGAIIWLGCNTQHSAPLLPCAQKLLLALALWHRLPRPHQVSQVTATATSPELHHAVMMSCPYDCACTLLQLLHLPCAWTAAVLYSIAHFCIATVMHSNCGAAALRIALHL